MQVSRRDVLAQLAALAASAALPRATGLRSSAGDPLDGTIADYVAGLRSGRWSAADVVEHALARCRALGAAWRAIDVLSPAAVADAKAADARLRARKPRGSLDGVSSRKRSTT